MNKGHIQDSLPGIEPLLDDKPIAIKPFKVQHEHSLSGAIIEECVRAQPVPKAILIQPNIISGAGVIPGKYADCNVVSLYLLFDDGSKKWLSDINKVNSNPSRDYSAIHCAAAKYSMSFGVPILPFNQVD